MILLDFDGVVNLYNHTTASSNPSNFHFRDYNELRSAGSPCIMADEVKEWIWENRDRIIWNSSWEKSTSKFTQIGLPELPYLSKQFSEQEEFLARHIRDKIIMSGEWKRGAGIRYAEEHPEDTVYWCDDDTWVNRDPLPNNVVPFTINPSYGLTREVLDQMS